MTIIIQKGIPFERTCQTVDGDDNPVPLTGYTIESQIRDKPDGELIAAFETEIIDEALAHYRLKLNEAATSGLEVGEFYFDVKFTPPAGNAQRSRVERISVKAGVTAAA